MDVAADVERCGGVDKHEVIDDDVRANADEFPAIDFRAGVILTFSPSVRKPSFCSLERPIVDYLLLS